MSFITRHIGLGTNSNNIKHMLHRIGVENINDLINQTNINRNFKDKIIKPDSESSCQENLMNMLKLNKPTAHLLA